MSSTQHRLARLEQRQATIEAPTPEKVAECQQFFHEHGGAWPGDATPGTVKLASALIENSARGMDIFKQEAQP